MSKELPSSYVINCFISATLLLLSISTVYAATTEILGTYRYPTENNFHNLRDQPFDNGNAYLSDYGLGLKTSLSAAQDGDKWEWEFVSPGSTNPTRTWVVGYYESFSGGSNCWVVNNTAGLGWPSISCNRSPFSTFELASSLSYCRELGAWTLQVRYTPGDGGPEQVFAAEPIPVVSTGANVKLQLSKSMISPKVDVTGSRGMTPFEPGTTDVTASVTDSGCKGFPIADQPVTINATTVAGSGGHTHLGEQEGTGHFETDLSNKKSISLITDDTGRASTTYTAGVVGLDETIKAVTVTDAGLTNEDTRNLSINIRAAGVYFISLPSSPDYEIYQSLTGAGKHVDGNNIYGTAKLISVIRQLAKDLKKHRQEATGQEDVRLLSVNDISLPNGGVFDLCKNLTECRGAGGHYSHEEGIDFDLNDFGGHSTRQFTTSNDDLRWLVWRVGKINPSCWKEHDIHIRCNDAIN